MIVIFFQIGTTIRFAVLLTAFGGGGFGGVGLGSFELGLGGEARRVDSFGRAR